MQSIILSIIRHSLTAGGGALIAKGYADQAGVDQLVGAIIALIGGGWSIYEKVKAKKSEQPV